MVAEPKEYKELGIEQTLAGEQCRTLIFEIYTLAVELRTEATIYGFLSNIPKEYKTIIESKMYDDSFALVRFLQGFQEVCKSPRLGISNEIKKFIDKLLKMDYDHLISTTDNLSEIFAEMLLNYVYF